MITSNNHKSKVRSNTVTIHKKRSVGKTTDLIESLYQFLNEDVPPVQPTSTQDFAPVTQVMKNVSLDQAVDRYLVRYEKESLPAANGMPQPPNAPVAAVIPQPPPAPANGVYESLNHLLEQLDDLDEEEPADDEEAPADDGGLGGETDDLGGDDLGGGAGPADGGGAPPAGGAAPAVPAAPVANAPRINLAAFTQAVARLANNYNNLLDPKTIILNRAEAYIKNNYDERTATEMMQTLEVNYGLKPVDLSNPTTGATPEYPQPYTVGALGGGGGGG